jgi:26S proteasome regulatory subunit N5
MSIPEGVQRKLNDYTSEVDTLLPTYIAQGQNDAELSNALSSMLNLEKRTRLAADTINSMKIVKVVLDLLHDRQKWELLNEYILILCKRRAQLQKVYETIVQQAFPYIETTPNDEVKRELIVALRTVTAGKIFVELERARLTKTLAEMEEKDGSITKASELMQDVTVETIGTMEIAEKAEFLLEQMRLCLELKDFVRTELIAKKVDKKALNNDPKLEDLKIRFYRLQIVFYLHYGNYFEISKAWREVSINHYFITSKDSRT